MTEVLHPTQGKRPMPDDVTPDVVLPERDQRKLIEITDPITARYLGFDVPQSDIDAANAADLKVEKP